MSSAVVAWSVEPSSEKKSSCLPAYLRREGANRCEGGRGTTTQDDARVEAAAAARGARVVEVLDRLELGLVRLELGLDRLEP